MTERPLFIDPIATGDGDDVDDNPAPRWFLAAALVILTLAAYYLGSFLNGPRASSPHRFEHGREVVDAGHGEDGHGEPGPTPAPSAASPAPATPSPTSTPERPLAPTQGQTTTRASTPTASPTG